MQFADDIKSFQKIAKKYNWPLQEVAFDNTLIWENKVIVVTDNLLNILHASVNIFEMTGYAPGEVVGNNPKMFQGTATEPDERSRIRQAVENHRPFKTIITNHKKDGSTYKCHIEAYPVFNIDGKLVNFVALENAA